MLSVTVYGFGSAFAKFDDPNDIDLLVLHQTADFQSCNFAILCKQHLVSRVARAHVTMLSMSELEQFQFITKANAIFIGTIREEHFELDIESTLDKIIRR